MDMEFTETQRRLSVTARQVLGAECPPGAVREMEQDERGFSPELWRKMADLGWPGLPFPEAYGGYGLGMVDTVVLLKELGRVLCPSPYIASVLLCGTAVLAAGTEEQKRRYLSRLIAGDLVMSFALQESSRRYGAEDLRTTVEVRDGGFVLTGTKRFVEFAGSADRLLVVARATGSGAEGPTMLLVDARHPGIRMKPLRTMARDRQFDVAFDEVVVPPEDVLGPVGGAGAAVEQAVQRGLVGLCAYMVGAAERVHELATGFAKDRVQFGRPIGSFQSVQHYLAQSIIEITGADTMTYYAAWLLDQGLPARETVAKAKAFAGDTFKRASAVGSHIYGGIGFVEEVDVSLYLRRGKQLQLSMGDSGYWEDVVADCVLGGSG